MAYETVILTKEEGVAVLTLNRPDKLNAVNMKMREEILEILAEMEKDNDIRVLIVTGNGRGFCSGADINEFAAGTEDPELQRTVNQTLIAMAKAFYEFEKPVIGAINGVAAGDGAQWTLAFDLNVASEKAKFAWPATALGILCPYGIIRLPVEVGRFRAKEVLMTKRFLTAEEGKEWGFINKVVPHEQLMDAALGLAREIMQMPPLSIRAVKKAVNRGMEGYEYAEYVLSTLQKTEDAAEGARAFLEKRTPVFKGR